MTNVGLRVAHLNCRSILPKVREIGDWMLQKSVDVGVFSETLLTAGKCCQIPGYSAIRMDMPTCKRGLAVFYSPLHVNIKHVRMVYDQVNTEYIQLKIKPKNGFSSFHLAVVYKNPSPDTCDTRILQDLLKENRSLLVGDLNARHDSLGGESRQNRAGLQLFEWLENDPRSPILLNEYGQHTRYYTRGGLAKANVLDLAICTPALYNLISTFEVGSDLNSDHLPVIVTFGDAGGPRTLAPRKLFRKTNWLDFQTYIQSKLEAYSNPLGNREEIDQAAQDLQNLPATAIDDAVPVKQQDNSLPPFIIKLIKERRRLRRKFARTREHSFKIQANKLAKEIKKLTHGFQQQRFNEMCQKLLEKSERLSERSFWQDIKKLLGRKTTLHYPSLTSGTTTAHTNVEKAELFNAFLDQRMTSMPSTDKDYQELIDNHSQLPTLKPLEVINPNRRREILEGQITIDEVTGVLSHLKTDSAPGGDNIPNWVLKYGLGESGALFLVDLFNACLSLGYFPALWKEAVITMIPKGDKNPGLVGSYRPISLTSCIGKVFEKLVNARLKAHLEMRGAFGEDQCAYRKGHSTYDNLVRLVQDALAARSEKRHAAAVFLDVEGAFDKVNHNSLLLKLTLHKTPPMLLRLLSSFLADRTFSVRVGGEAGTPRTLRAGVPQGSILGPILFLVYVGDMPTPNNRDIRKSQYADDMGIWGVGGCRNTLLDSLQTYLTQIEHWCDKEGILLNAPKSQAIFFFKHYRTRLTPLRLRGQDLPFCKEVKFLGIELDQNLTLNSHIKKRIAKGRAMCHAFARVARLTKLSSHTLKLLYRAYIESFLTYGAPILVIVSDSNLNDLQKITNIALRICYDAPSYTKTSYLLQLAGLPSLVDRIWQLGVGWLTRVRTQHLHQFNLRPMDLPDDRSRLIPVLTRLWSRLDRNLQVPPVGNLDGIA